MKSLGEKSAGARLEHMRASVALGRVVEERTLIRPGLRDPDAGESGSKICC